MPPLSADSDADRPHDGAGVFATTHWSVVLQAGNGESPSASEALDQLCRVYWYPLYAYVRQRGYSRDDAQDLTQSFFLRLLERDLLADLKPAGAKFRSFLLAALKNHLAGEWVRAHAAKRGGMNPVLSLDALDPETRYAQEPEDTASPDAAFDRRWAETVLQQALERLRTEQTSQGKEAVFEALAGFLTGSGPTDSYADLAVQLVMSEAAVKMTVHRLRKRYGELLRLEVANTVSTAAEVQQELRCLLAAISAG